MSENPRKFWCSMAMSDYIEVEKSTENALKVAWRPSTQFVCLSRASCREFIAQLQHYVDTGELLSEDPPEVTDEAKEQVKALLAAVGVEVDPEQLRVIQSD